MMSSNPSNNRRTPEKSSQYLDEETGSGELPVPACGPAVGQWEPGQDHGNV